MVINDEVLTEPNNTVIQRNFELSQWTGIQKMKLIIPFLPVPFSQTLER